MPKAFCLLTLENTRPSRGCGTVLNFSAMKECSSLVLVGSLCRVVDLQVATIATRLVILTLLTTENLPKELTANISGPWGP